MAISNSINFTVTRDDIITESLEQLGVLGEGEAPTVDQLASSSRTLNMMTKTWQADGLNLFSIIRQYLFLVKTQKEYTLSSTTTDHFTANFIETTLSAAAVETATTVFVTSDTGMAVLDNIGITTGTDVFWTTITALPGAGEITLTDALPNDVTASSVVYTYTSKANRPMKIMESFITISSNTDIPVGNISRRDYNRLSVKDTVGVVNQFYYDPQIDNGKLFVWPTTDDESNYLTLFVQRTLSDFDNPLDNPEYPQEWYLPLALSLAVELAPKYGIPDQQYYKLLKQSEKYYEKAKGFDDELYTSVYFTVDKRGEDL